MSEPLSTNLITLVIQLSGFGSYNATIVSQCIKFCQKFQDHKSVVFNSNYHWIQIRIRLLLVLLVPVPITSVSLPPPPPPPATIALLHPPPSQFDPLLLVHWLPPLTCPEPIHKLLIFHMTRSAARFSALYMSWAHLFKRYKTELHHCQGSPYSPVQPQFKLALGAAVTLHLAVKVHHLCSHPGLLLDINKSLKIGDQIGW